MWLRLFNVVCLNSTLQVDTRFNAQQEILREGWRLLLPNWIQQLHRDTCP